MELTVPNVSRAIKDMYNKEKAENLPTPNLIIGEVSRFYNIEESVIRGTLKNKNTAEARQVAMYLVRKLTNLSLPDIGKEFGRDHSTVIHSLKRSSSSLPQAPERSPTTSATLRPTSTASSDFVHTPLWNPHTFSVESCETEVSQNAC